MHPDQIAFIERLKVTDEVTVRYSVRHGKYTGRHKAWADGYVAELDAAALALAEAKSDASNAEHLRIARSEKNAAWVAAISAIVAIIISVIALYLSWLSLNRP